MLFFDGLFDFLPVKYLISEYGGKKVAGFKAESSSEFVNHNSKISL